jgi:hypothetical protein
MALYFLIGNADSYGGCVGFKCFEKKNSQTSSSFNRDRRSICPLVTTLNVTDFDCTQYQRQIPYSYFDFGLLYFVLRAHLLLLLLLLLSHFSLCLFQASEFPFTYGSFRHLIGLLGRGISPAPRPLPTQDNTTQRNTHLYLMAQINSYIYFLIFRQILIKLETRKFCHRRTAVCQISLTWVYFKSDFYLKA